MFLKIGFVLQFQNMSDTNVAEILIFYKKICQMNPQGNYDIPSWKNTDGRDDDDNDDKAGDKIRD